MDPFKFIKITPLRRGGQAVERVRARREVHEPRVHGAALQVESS
jgi:hypothetical protein